MALNTPSSHSPFSSNPAPLWQTPVEDAPKPTDSVLFLARGPLLVFALTVLLIVPIFGAVMSQNEVTTAPTLPVEPVVRGKILAADGSILADGPVTQRSYPYGDLAGNLLGFTGAVQPDGRYGLEGLEYSLDSALQAGENIMLTIDPHLQSAAEYNLRSAATEFGAETGSAVVLEVGTGRILASASYPPIDPNDWRGATAEQMVNRPFVYAYEPGSVIKPILVAAALESGRLSTSDVIDTPMALRVGLKTFQDVASHDPQLTPRDILAYSSNSGMIHIGQRFSSAEYANWLEQFGFGNRLHLKTVANRGGLINDPETWVPQDHAAASIGQSFTTTALQLAAAYQIIANDGVYVSPTINPTEELPAPRRVLSAETAQSVREMLIHTMNQGGLRNAQIPGVVTGGKTGTSDVYSVAEGRYIPGDYAVSFAGMVPADAPKYVVVVTLEKPRTNTSSTYTAAPLFRSIASEVLAANGIAPAPPETLAGP